MRDALVVGINTYQSLPNLKAPARDAEAIAEQLHTYGEFRVHRLPEVIQEGKPAVGQKTQVTLRELETALISLFKPKGNNIPQTALFYFSGHGIQRDAGIQEGYLALSDSQPEKGFYGLSLFWLRRLLQESPVRQRIVILDCCHSGELLNFLEADPGAHPGTDRLFMAASREYETAFESLDSPYSVFTQAILTGLDPNRLEAGIVTNHSLTDHVNHTLKGEIQQPLFESSGSEIILTRRNGLQSQLPLTIRTTDRCPYRGLSFFDEEHAEYFFGREDLTQKLIQQLKTDRFVAVVGASGIGKSSLVRAGMVAQLRQEKTSLGDDRWRIKLVTPTAHPLKGLAAAFVDPNCTELERAEQLRRVETFLAEGGMGLAQLVQACLPLETDGSRRGEKERPRLLLVIDQFEDVFNLTRGAQAEQERQHFFQCLLEAMELAPNSLSVVIVLRSDFLAKCALHDLLYQKIEHHQLQVPPLKYDQIKATILRPAQKVGLVCEPHLVYTMLLDISGAPGELPLLQYTLMELWQHRRIGKEGGVARLTLETYQQLGGVRGTLQKRATEVFHQLTPSEQNVAKRIFLSLTHLGEGTEDTRRRVQKAELISPAYSEEMVDRVLEKLVAAKLIVTHQEVDVIHEALIRNWTLLRGWLSENRETLHRLRRIEQAAQEWDMTGQSSNGDYLLYGLRLQEAEELLRRHSSELSALAQQFIAVSQAEMRRARRESRQLQVAIPSVLLATLTVVFGLYHNSVRSQAEKNEQLQQATSRERAAIAQSILQDTNNDPMTALLIGRLAAEEGGASFEAQTSLRSALQSLRLQLELQGHTDAVHQVIFSADRRYLASAGADGTIRLWSLNPQTVYNARPNLASVLHWSTCPEDCSPEAASAKITSIAFSPDGKYIAGVAQDTNTLKLWSVESGALVQQLTASASVRQFTFSPNGVWLASIQSDRSVALWQTDTGSRAAHILQSGEVNTVEFSPNGQFLLTAGNDRMAHLWQLNFQPTEPLQVEKALTLTHSSPVNQATFNADGQQIATASTDGKVRLWETTTGQLMQTLDAKTFERQAVDPTRQEEIQATAEPMNSAATAAFNPDSVPSDLNIKNVSQTVPNPDPHFLQLQFSPDKQHLAIADTQHRIWLWDFQSGQIRRSLMISNPPDLPQSAVEVPPTHTEPDLWSFNPTGHLLVTASAHDARSDGTHHVTIWNAHTGDRVGILPGHRAAVEAVQFSPDGTYVATASADGVVRLWAAEPGGELPTLTLPSSSIEWAMFIQSGAAQNQTAERLIPPRTSQLAAYPFSQAVAPQLLALNIGLDRQEKIPSPELASASASLVTVSPDGQFQHWQIVTGNTSFASPPSLALTSDAPDLRSQSFWQQLLELAGNPFRGFAPVEKDVTISPDLSHPLPSPIQLPLQLAVGYGEAGTTTVGTTTVGTTTGTAPTRLTQPPLSSVALSPDGQLMAIAVATGRIEIRRTQTDQSTALVHQIQNWRLGVSSQAVLSEVLPHSSAPDRRESSDDITIQPSSTGQLKTNEPIAVRQLVFSPDGQRLMAIANDFTIRLWDVQTGEMLHALRGHEATVQQAQFSSNGESIVSASWDRTVRIWSTTTGETLRTIHHPDAVNSARFSPNHQYIITAGWDGIARVFKANTGEQKFLLARHQQAVLDAEFSPDGQRAVTAGADGTAYLWEMQTGTAEAELRLPQTNEPLSLLQASFSPDGQYVATLSKDGRVHLWAATWEMLLKLSRDRSLRQLTPDECSRYLKLAPNECPMLPLGEG